MTPKRCFSVNIPKVIATASFMEQIRWLLLNYVLVSDRNFKKESREIAFELISLFHVQIQEPKSMSTTTRAFVCLSKFLEFYYHKIFQTRSWWVLSFCMVECSLCGLSITGDLSMSCNGKVMMLLWRSALLTSITELLLLPKFDNSCPSVTRDKEICHVMC